jgi:starvation-inducible DNA-binding protein
MDNVTTLHLAKIALANSFFLSFKAHTYHWNIEGDKFLQLHEFFGDVYENAEESVDKFAEEIRALGEYAPRSIPELQQYVYINTSNEAVSADQMLADLLESNLRTIETLTKLFDALSLTGEQGFANFAADRIDQHKKQNWMIRSLLKKA